MGSELLFAENGVVGGAAGGGGGGGEFCVMYGSY